MLQLEQFHNVIYFHWFLLQQSVVAKNVLFLSPALWKESAAFGSVEMKFLWLLFITDCHCILQRMPCKYNEKIIIEEYCSAGYTLCKISGCLCIFMPIVSLRNPDNIYTKLRGCHIYTSTWSMAATEKLEDAICKSASSHNVTSNYSIRIFKVCTF